jgi:hypothetical protein
MAQSQAAGGDGTASCDPETVGATMRRIALALAICLFPSIVLSWDFSVPQELGTKDALFSPTVYLHEFKKGGSAAGAQALCYGPLLQFSHGPYWIADFFSVCVAGSVAMQPQPTGSQISGEFGIMPLNLMGLQGSYFYSPFENKQYYGVSADLLHAIKRIAPPVVTAVTTVVTPPVAPSK